MRAFVFFALVGLAYGQVRLGHPMEKVVVTEYQTRLFEGAINKSAECIKNLLKNGDESIDLPPLDPIVIENLDLNLEDYGFEHISGKLGLKNVLVAGQLNWLISKLKVSPTIFPIGVKVTLAIDWNSASFSADYDVDANVLNHAVNGVGQVTGSATNFKLDISLQGTLSRIGVKNLKVQPTLEAIDFKIGKLSVDNSDISEIINESVTEILKIVQDNLDEIGEAIAQAIMDLINKNALYQNEKASLTGIIAAIADCIEL